MELVKITYRFADGHMEELEVEQEVAETQKNSIGGSTTTIIAKRGDTSLLTVLKRSRGLLLMTKDYLGCLMIHQRRFDSGWQSINLNSIIAI